MDDLVGKLEGLKIAHDLGHVDSLISKLQTSSYVSSATRSRVVDLIKGEVQTVELTRLGRIFSQSTACYIRREDVRQVIEILHAIKRRERVTPLSNQATWLKEEWFHRLVDGEIIPPLRKIFDDLEVCRINIISSLCTIVLFGSKAEGEFFAELRKLFSSSSSSDGVLSNMPETTAREIFKYYGGIVINGSLDCAAYAMAGNNMKSIATGSLDGAIGGFFQFGEDRLISVTADHVVPIENKFKVENEDVAFVELDGSVVKSVCNPLFIEPDSGMVENFNFNDTFPTGLTEGRLISVADSVTYWEKEKKFDAKNCVSVAWRSDERFTVPGDSGSIYYAVRGCFRYPIAVHRASLVVRGRPDETMEDENGKHVRVDSHQRISIGTPLAVCLESFAEEFNGRKYTIDDPAANEDEPLVPKWIARFDHKEDSKFKVEVANLQKARDGVDKEGSEEDDAVQEHY
eukprot:scaffold7232_cov310-Ochromonas_danica.AAC.11